MAEKKLTFEQQLESVEALIELMENDYLDEAFREIAKATGNDD